MRGIGARFATAVVAIAIFTALSSCSVDQIPGTADVPDIMAEAAGARPEPKFGDSDVRRAVRMSFRTMLRFDSIHVAEVGALFSRPELYSYLLRANSFVGGTFPQKTAVLLREVQRADFEYLAAVESFASVLSRRLDATDLPPDQRHALENELTKEYSTRQQSYIEAVQAFDRFVGAVAEVYELAAKNPSSFKDMRTGLEIESDVVLEQYNNLVDKVNAAHAVADSAIRRLPPEQQIRFTRMRVTKPVKT